ncbi:retrovirus-related pol polyprotein from transposon TNT 1-94 [Tanacetum coccineum]
MKEVHYHDWLSNPVMVKKHDDSWRMCVDFKDLNKACPKDGYPLPEIDWKVESLCGFPFKCFLDAYKGYHQIQMAKEDEEKTAFITSQGIFCYTKMPFGLRNAGATYQRLVDKAFHKQIGRNLEVYVDDLVIKSRTEDEIVRDIEETFKTLREINMKLNPKKCTFRVEEGMPRTPMTKTSDHNRSELDTQDHNNEPSSSKLVPNVSLPTDTDAPSLQELDLLFSPLYEEFFTAGNPKVAESSSRNVDNSNMHTFYQRHQSDYRWTKNHPIEQVRGNPSKLVQTRRLLAIDPERRDSSVRQTQSLGTCRQTLWKDGIKLKLLWKNKKDEDNIVIRNKARLVAKGYAHEEEFYVAQPNEFVDPDHPEKVYRLRKAQYKLKQAPRAWYDELLTFLMYKGFTKGTIDPTLFMIRYKEDILLAKYALEILKKHGMDKCDIIGTPMSTKPKLDADLSGLPVDQTKYRSMIGSLIYLTSSRPDLVQAGTINMGLWYPKDFGFELTAFSDVDHAGCLDTRKSISGEIQFLGEKLVSWMSKKQDCTAMSTAEAEYLALSASSIAISCNPMQQSRTKYINVCHHFIKEQVERGIIELYFVITEYQLAGMFTKALSQDRFEYLARRLGMRCLTPAELEVLAKETA